MKLHIRLSLMNIIFIIITLSLMIGITYKATIPKVEAQSITLVEATASEISGDLSDKIGQSKQLVRGLSISSLLLVEDASGMEDNLIKQELITYLEFNPDVYSVYITHFNGTHTKVIIVFREAEGSSNFISDIVFSTEFSQDEVFQFLIGQVESLEKGDVINTPAYYDTAFVNKPMISLLAPIVVNNVNFGFVGVDIVMEDVLNAISRIPEILGEESYGIITDIDETILAHPSEKWNYTNNWNREETLKFSDWAKTSGIETIDTVVDATQKDKTITQVGDNLVITVNLVENTGWNLIIISPDTLVYSISQSFQLTGLIVGTLTWLIFGSITYYSNRYKVANKIVDISELAKQMAAGDLTGNVELETNIDEISELGESFNHMIKNMKELLLNMKQTSSLLSTNSQELSSATEEINASAEEVASTSQAMSDGATTQTELIAEVNEDVEKVQHIVDDIVKKIQLNTQEVAQIALQTNILALNAGIEASRAGDYGRGFAVVAENVRKLSDQSKMASERIETVADEIRDTLLASFNRISSTMINVVSVSEETAASAEEVAAAAEEMTATIEEISTTALTLTKNAEESDEAVNQFKFE